MKFKSLFVLIITIGQTLTNDYSPCTKKCGGGTKTQTFTCGWGNSCERSVFCNTQPCAPSQFNIFTKCSQPCGGGYRFKAEQCTENDVNICPKVYEDCNVEACTPLPSCPSNHKFRYRNKASCCKESYDTCGVPNKAIQLTQRIFGGDKSKNGEWPWMNQRNRQKRRINEVLVVGGTPVLSSTTWPFLAVIVIKDSKTTHCGGSLIHKDYVLTAAHCVDAYDKTKYYVMLGSTTIKFPKATKQIIEIEDFIAHELYSDPEHDVGLVKLQKSAVFNDVVKPICLPNGEEMKVDTTCVVAGWGIARPEHLSLGITSDILQHVSIRNLPKDACVEGLKGYSWRIPYFNKNENLCFGILAGDKDTCRGDSGGPVMCQRCSSCGWYVAGVTSYGPDICGTKSQPGVYMYVKVYESWIRKKVSGIPMKSFSC